MIDKICLFLECTWIVLCGIVGTVIAGGVSFSIAAMICGLLIQTVFLTPLALPVIAYSAYPPVYVIIVTWEQLKSKLKLE